MTNEKVQIVEAKKPHNGILMYRNVHKDDCPYTSKIPIEALYPGLTPLVEPHKRQSVVSCRRLVAAKSRLETTKAQIHKVDTPQCINKSRSEQKAGIYDVLSGTNSKVTEKDNMGGNELTGVHKGSKDDSKYHQRNHYQPLSLSGAKNRKMSNHSINLIDFSDPCETEEKNKHVDKETATEDNDNSSRNFAPMESFRTGVSSKTIYIRNIDSGQAITRRVCVNVHPIYL